MRRLENLNKAQTKEEEKNNSSKETKKRSSRKLEPNQKLLTQYIVTKPRASQPASSQGNSTIKEGCSSGTEGRGVGASGKEGTGGPEPQEKRQDPNLGHHRTRTGIGRARLGLPERREGSQARKGSREGVKDTSREEGRPGNQDGKRFRDNN